MEQLLALSVTVPTPACGDDLKKTGGVLRVRTGPEEVLDFKGVGL